MHHQGLYEQPVVPGRKSTIQNVNQVNKVICIDRHLAQATVPYLMVPVVAVSAKTPVKAGFTLLSLLGVLQQQSN